MQIVKISALAMKPLQTIIPLKLGIKSFYLDNQPNILILSSILIIVYSLYIFIPFGTYDDYERAWNYITSPQTAGNEQILLNAMDGRIFTGVLISLFFKPSNISYFGIYRISNLLLILIFSYILYIFLIRSINKTSALLLCIVICTLPSFSTIFYFASLIGVIAGGIFSGLSVLLLLKTPSFHLSDKNFKLRLLFSSILLLVALQFYQPIAMFYWVFVAIVLSFDRQQDLKTFISKYLYFLLVFILSLGVAYLILRITPLIAGLPIKQRTAIIGLNELSNKIKWFFTTPLPQSLNFFLLLSIPMKIVIGTIIYILGGLIVWFRGSGINRVVKAVIILSVFPLSYFPNLIVAENWASFRSMIALSSVWVFLLYISSKGLFGLFTQREKLLTNIRMYAMIIWALIAVVFSLYNSLTYIIIPGFMEHRFIHYKLSEFHLKTGDKVYVSLANYTDSSSPYFYGDEFGIPTTAYTWGARNLSNLVIQEFGFTPGQVQVITIEDVHNFPVDQPGTYLLDLHMMKEFQLRNNLYPIERIKQKIDSIFQHL